VCGPGSMYGTDCTCAGKMVPLSPCRCVGPPVLWPHTALLVAAAITPHTTAALASGRSTQGGGGGQAGRGAIIGKSKSQLYPQRE
jgi:hypothetical protein